MKLNKYLKDNSYWFILNLLFFLIMLLLFIAFKIPLELIIAICILFSLLIISLVLIGFYRKRNFYNELMLNLERLDKKFLILETIKKPTFYEGEILVNCLYDINKSMLENIKEYEISINDFREYLEIWIHEIKIPVASMILMYHNHQNKFNKNSLQEIKKIDNLLEQILYYVRSNNAELDYLIKEISLANIANSVALKNKDDLLAKKINLTVKDLNLKVFTDAKWIEFILNQIINNSVKYMDKMKKENYIKIYSEEDSEKIILNILDNGVGIKNSDLERVFDKTFTGTNTHNMALSTGMGLYIVKKLCKKLGHNIQIESVDKQYTLVKIIFYKNDFYNVIEK